MMFMRTDEETADMSRKAKLRWEYFTHMLDNYGPKPVVQKKASFLSYLENQTPKKRANGVSW